jgi:hypothetical protein
MTARRGSARRGLAVAGLMAGALIALPAHAGGGDPAPLAGVTTIHADWAGTTDVVLTHRARLSPKSLDNPDVTIAGEGRYVGFTLTRSHTFDGLSAYRLPSFMGGQVQVSGRVAPTAQCAPKPNETLPLTYDCTDLPKPRHFVLPAGRYHLSVITDGSPLSITLHLRGLAGTTQIRPAERLRVVQAKLPERTTAGSTAALSFGDWRTAAVNGTFAVFATVDRAMEAATVQGRELCIRFDEVRPMAETAFQPGCSHAQEGSFAYTVNGAGTGYGIFGGSGMGTTSNEQVDVGLGGSFTDSGGVTLTHTLGVWIDQPDGQF